MESHLLLITVYLNRVLIAVQFSLYRLYYVRIKIIIPLIMKRIFSSTRRFFIANIKNVCKYESNTDENYTVYLEACLQERVLFIYESH